MKTEDIRQQISVHWQIFRLLWITDKESCSEWLEKLQYLTTYSVS